MSDALDQNDIILVVDDSAEALRLANDVLEDAGVNVLVALEGQQAITIARRLRPDMILLDAVMPHMDGFETCRRLKAEPGLADIPVIFMTGLADTDSVVRGLQVGGVDYLTKPINPDELLARIRVHLHNARLARNAYSALDSTGQHLFTLDAGGRILWATPQTFALLARARAGDSWLESEFSSQLTDWLGCGRAPGDALALSGLDHPLIAKLIAADPEQPPLLKLQDGLRPTGEQALEVAFGLTRREAEVLFWIANGKTNREIGEILGMSPRTANKHLEAIFPKLGVENRTAAAARAIRALVEESV